MPIHGSNGAQAVARSTRTRAPWAWGLLFALACGACQPPELRGGEVLLPPKKHSTPKDAGADDTDAASPPSASTSTR
jgi:hypothetical protein